MTQTSKCITLLIMHYGKVVLRFPVRQLVFALSVNRNEMLFTRCSRN